MEKIVTLCKTAMMPLPSYARPAALSLLVLLLCAVARPVQAQDTHDTIRVRAYHDGAMKTAAEGTLLCPGNVRVGIQALTIDYEVTTTSTNPVQYAATFAFSNQTLEATVTSDTHGDPAPVLDSTTTSYTVEGLLSNTMPFRVGVVVTAAAAGPATTDWEVRRAGAITQEEHCTFDVLDTIRGSFHGVAFLDLDGDGTQTTDEPGLVGRMIFNDTNGNAQYDPGVDPSMPTDATGHYTFTDVELPATLGQEIPQGWEGTFPVGGFHTIGEDGQQADFGSRPRSGAILGVKWEDRNANGQIDEGEPRLEGWQIYLDLNNNGMLDDGEPSAVTDAGGQYGFGDLAPGTYTVREVQQEGFAQTYPQNPDHYTVTLAQGQYVGGIRFGNRPVGSIHGVKYLDQPFQGGHV